MLEKDYIHVFYLEKKKKEGKLRESYSQIDLVFACL